MPTLTEEELLAYADELLPEELTVEIEKQLRVSESLRARLQNLLQNRDQGAFSLGDIWRHQRLSCPGRSEWSLLLVGAVEAAQRDYLEFHRDVVGCVYCRAEWDDLTQALQAQTEAAAAGSRRQEKLFTSSAGLLRGTSSASGWPPSSKKSLNQPSTE